jgi:hypothetical protein
MFATSNEIAGEDIDELVSLFAQLDGDRQRIEAQLATVVNEVERRGLHALDGHATVKGWCRALGRWSTAEAHTSARIGRLLHASPAAAEAASAGVLGVAQLQALARGFANPRCGDQLLLVIDLLIEHAQQLSFDEFNLVMRRWEMLADADGSFRDHEAAHRGRTASVKVTDGSVDIRAQGGSAQGVSIKEIFQRYVDAEFELDWAATVAQYGDGACPALMPRTDAQRRFDAFHRVFLAAASTSSDAQPPEPVVNIITTLDTLEDAVVRAAGATHARQERQTGPTSPGEDPWRWRAETTNGDLLSPNDILAAALIGHVRRVVVDSAGVIINLGRKRRLFTGNQRDAVLMGSARCIWPGCVQPSGRCQADHLHEWQYNGSTNIANAAPLCAHHNRWKARGYATTRDANGYWHTYRPNGTEIA